MNLAMWLVQRAPLVLWRLLWSGKSVLPLAIYARWGSFLSCNPRASSAGGGEGNSPHQLAGSTGRPCLSTGGRAARPPRRRWARPRPTWGGRCGCREEENVSPAACHDDRAPRRGGNRDLARPRAPPPSKMNAMMMRPPEPEGRGAPGARSPARRPMLLHRFPQPPGSDPVAGSAAAHGVARRTPFTGCAVDAMRDGDGCLLLSVFQLRVSACHALV